MGYCTDQFVKKFIMTTHTEFLYAILWKNKKAPDHLVADYKDFLQHRDMLPYYRFNPKTMHGILEMALAVFWTDQRIDRNTLLMRLMQFWDQYQRPKSGRTCYYHHAQFEKLNWREPLGAETLELLAELCVGIMTSKERPWSDAQHPKLLSQANQLIWYQPIAEKYVKIWLKHCHLDEKILNRVLQYPAPSKAITAWAKHNWENNHLRRRRAELTAWLLDENPDFAVSLDVLIADFEQANEEDKQEFARVKGYYESASPLDETFPGMFSTLKEPMPNFWEQDEFGHENWIEGADFKPRFFNHKNFGGMRENPQKPDFAKMTQFFYSNLETTQKVTMLWAIYYSHLTLAEKRKLLKKWYAPEMHRSLFRIIRKLGDIKMMEWLGEQKLRG